MCAVVGRSGQLEGDAGATPYGLIALLEPGGGDVGVQMRMLVQLRVRLVETEKEGEKER